MSSSIFILNIGSSETNTKILSIPDNINLTNCEFILHKNEYSDTFKFMVHRNNLIVTRTDAYTGWKHDHNVYINYITSSSIQKDDIIKNDVIKNDVIKNDVIKNNIYILNIGSSDSNTKVVPLPDSINILNCEFILCENEYTDTFNFIVDNNSLIVTRTDTSTGWGHDHNVYINSIIPLIINKENIERIPKVIYMTYKSYPPDYVFKNWKELNPNYTIDFSLDSDCIQFLKDNFTIEIADLFKNIKEGMYKADLWRLCKLYINGGIYADVDLKPYISVDNLIKDDYTFYSCLAVDKKSIFQAFMITEPYNPLILQFIISFINNKPYNKMNGPTYDMYNNITSLVKTNIESEKVYNIDMVQIPLNIGSSDTNIKIIETFFNIPNNSTIKIKEHNNKDTFSISYNNNIITIKRIDINSGWGYDHMIDINIPTNQRIMLFTEVLKTNNIADAYVSYKDNKILDSRYINYYNAKQHNQSWN
jgi:hypothetical protein